MSWSGFYFGAQAGYSSMNTDFGDALHDWVGFSLRNSALENKQHPENWKVLPSADGSSTSYGAFIGYNMQWDQLVLGFDAAYNRMSSMRTAAADGLTRVTADPHDTVSIYGRSSMQLVDYATLRGRAGYAFGQFLPYGILGLAVGRFNYTKFGRMQVKGDDTLGPISMQERKNDAAAAGFVAGLGIDVALMPNVFLRGEWEYIAFTELAGIRNTLNTAHVGIALKF
jgi:opacity protein-like surface antigen